MMEARERNRDKKNEIATAVLKIATKFASELHPDQPHRLVHLSDRLESDLGFDSLSRMEFLRRLEEELGLSLSESILFRTDTLQELMEALVACGLTSRQRSLPMLAGTIEPLPPEQEPAEVSTLPECLEWHVQQHGDRTHAHFIGEDGRITALSYSDLAQDAKKIAGALAASGVSPGDRIALMLPTSFSYLKSFYGALFAGAVPVPIYPPASFSRLEEHLSRQARIIENCGATRLILPPEWMEKKKGLRFLIRSLAPSLERVFSAEELQSKGMPFALPRNARDLALIQYTSGSTGNPKGVALSHANLLANIRAMGKMIQASNRDIVVSWLPLYHDMGLIGAWLGSLYYGASLYLLSPFSFLSQPIRWLEAIHQFRATFTTAPNFAYELCVKRITQEQLTKLNLESLRACFNGAEPVSALTIRNFWTKFSPCKLRREALKPVYGLAECAVGLSFPPLSKEPVIDRIDREILQSSGRSVPSLNETKTISIVSCGLPLPNHEVRIVDAQGKELPERMEGRIQFRGPSATSGYFNNPEENKKLFEDDWLNTGDLGYRAQGELYVTGRSKDVLIRAGRKIQPHEVEEWVGLIPEVRKGGVAVFGLPDPSSGTERFIIVAETLLKNRGQRLELTKTIRKQVFALENVAPDEIILLKPHSLPKTSSGKLRRFACREAYQNGKLGRKNASPSWQIMRILFQAGGSRVMHFWQRLGDRAYSLYVWGVAGIILPGVWLATLLANSRPRARQIIQWGAQILGKSAGIPMEIKGKENLPESPCLLVVNHSSYLDAFVLAALLPAKFSYTAKSEFSKNLLLHPFFTQLGTLYLDRASPEAASLEVQKMRAALHSGESLVVFPEGTFTRKAGLLPFRFGAFLTAALAGVPVVPLSITGTREILGAESFWLHRGGKICVTVGEAMYPKSQKDKDSTWMAAMQLREKSRREILRMSGTADLALENRVIVFPEKSWQKEA